VEGYRAKVRPYLQVLRLLIFRRVIISIMAGANKAADKGGL